MSNPNIGLRIQTGIRAGDDCIERCLASNPGDRLGCANSCANDQGSIDTGGNAIVPAPSSGGRLP